MLKSDPFFVSSKVVELRIEMDPSLVKVRNSVGDIFTREMISSFEIFAFTEIS